MDSNKTHAQDEQGITPAKFEEINKVLEIHGVHGMTRATLVWLSSALDKKLRTSAPAPPTREEEVEEYLTSHAAVIGEPDYTALCAKQIVEIVTRRTSGGTHE